MLAHAESRSCFEGPSSYFETSVNVVPSDDCQNVFAKFEENKRNFILQMSAAVFVNACNSCWCCLSFVITVAWGKMANRPKCTCVRVCLRVCVSVHVCPVIIVNK